MYLVVYGNTETQKFSSEDNYEDLFPLIAEHNGYDPEMLVKAMKGFENDYDRVISYIKLYNAICAIGTDAQIYRIYKIEEWYEDSAHGRGE